MSAPTTLPTPTPKPTTQSPSTSSARSRMNDLEGYRGLAAVGIVIFHAYQFARGNATSSYAYPHTIWQPLLRNLDGLVSMFLILSGFLLYLPLVSKLRDGQRGPVRVFLLRRAARILPLYWLAILLVWASRNPSLPGDWRDLIEHLTFTQVFDSERMFYTIGPAWSLSVEIWFYLFLAAAYVAFNHLSQHLHSRRARLGVMLAPPALLLTASLCWQLWAVYGSHQPATRWAIWFNPIARADMMAAGMAIAVLYGMRTSAAPVTRRVLLPMRLLALAMLAYGCAIRTDATDTTTLFNLLSTGAFTLLIASSVLDHPQHRWRRILAGPRLAWLGLTSYSLYMWHEPVLLWLDQHLGLDHAQAAFPITALILLTTSVPIGWLSYRIIEQPLGRLRLLLDNHGQRRNYYPEPEATAAG
jgi:peptidoglycan/LPS O-acetylase OafA/YrhL